MDTVLNLGLNADTLQGVIKAIGNPRFGYDSFRRFIQMFSKIVLDIEDAVDPANKDEARAGEAPAFADDGEDEVGALLGEEVEVRLA